jgi:hypothetical protein
MRSGFAKLFLLAAVLYALFTLGELITAVGQLLDAYGPTNDKIFQTSAYIVRWAVDPLFLCGTAVMVEFLERIWKELARANAKRDAAGTMEG